MHSTTPATIEFKVLKLIILKFMRNKATEGNKNYRSIIRKDYSRRKLHDKSIESFESS
jgi:hypothetical protein